MNQELNIQQLVSYITDNCSKSERELVEKWLALSNDNMLLFDEFKKVWDSSSVKNDVGIVDIDAAWADFKKRANFVETKTVVSPEVITISSASSTSVKKILYYSARVAAVIALVFGLYLFFEKDTPVEIHNYVAASVQTEESSLHLPDGSSVVMNKGARINYPDYFTSDTRNVNFKGEAFFDIAHNPDKPMIIATGDIRVMVLGTSFNLCNCTDLDEITVYLESGKILFYSIDDVDGSILEQIILYPGQKGVYNKNTGLITKHNFSDKNHVAWKTGVLEFANAPLTNVVKVLEHTYQVSINSEINIEDCHLTACFSNESLSSIFESLQIIYNFEYKINDNSVLIY